MLICEKCGFLWILECVLVYDLFMLVFDFFIIDSYGVYMVLFILVM